MWNFRTPSSRMARMGPRAESLNHVIGADIEKRHDSTRASLAPFDLPRKRSDDTAKVEHLIDVATHILRMDATILKGQVMHGKDVTADMAPGEMVRVVVLAAEELQSLHTHMLFEPGEHVWTHVANRGVHGMITGTRIDSPPSDFHLCHPARKLNAATRVHRKIADKVLIWLPLVVPVEPSVNDQDVPLLHLYLRRDVFGLDDVPVGDNIRHVNDDPLVNEFGQWE